MMKPRYPITIATVVRKACQRRWLGLFAAIALSLVAVFYISGHFRMTSDTTALFSPKVEWRQREIVLSKAFPQNNDTIVVVVDGATPELAERAASQLSQKLTPQSKFFLGVRRPDGGPFFTREGLLF